MILDGQMVADIRNHILKKRIMEDTMKGLKPPRIAIINVGDNPASHTYIKAKKKAALSIGIDAAIINFAKDVESTKLEFAVNEMNANTNIDGIIIQLPLPKHLSENKFINLISPNKDIDGFTLINQGLLFQNQKSPRAATPQGILNLLDYYKIDVSGMNAVIIGASQIVGLPVSKLLLDRGATVTICHLLTKDLTLYTKTADIIISAAGVPNLITKEMIKEQSIIIDVGMNRLNNKLVGDVDYLGVFNKCSYITPVPKGVGPMTINALLENTYDLVVSKRNL